MELSFYLMRHGLIRIGLSAVRIIRYGQYERGIDKYSMVYITFDSVSFHFISFHMASTTSILEDPTNYIVQYSEKTKYSCVLLGVSLLFVILFFISPLSVSSKSWYSWVTKFIVIAMLAGTSVILFQAVKPIMDTKGVIETDMFPDLKNNFFITVGFIMLIIVLGIVVLRL